MGRPSTFNQDTADCICELIASGQTLREVCRAEDMPAMSTVLSWVGINPQFSVQYARARASLLEVMADEIVEISDDGTNDYMERLNYNGGKPEIVVNGEHVNRSRLRVDSRKWLLSKLRPDKYGDRTDLTVSGPGGGPVDNNLTVRFVDAIDGKPARELPASREDKP